VKTTLMILVSFSLTCLQQISVQATGFYTLGHGDVRAYYEGGELKLRYQLDYNAVVGGSEVGTFETGPQSFGLSELIVHIPNNPIGLPAGLPEYDFIGATAGDPLWYVPEVQEEDRPWLGFSSQELSVEDWVGPSIGDVSNYGMLRLDLVSVTGPPGYFSLFQTGPGGEPLISFATSDGIDSTDIYGSGSSFPGFPTSTHTHASWFFTQPGFYDVTLKFSGTHMMDGYKEAVGTIRFAVAVPEPSGIFLAVVSGVGLATVCMRRARIQYGALFLMLGIGLPGEAQAAHLDIVPYFEILPNGDFAFSAGRFDFNKTWQSLNGLPPAVLERNVLAFTGAFQQHPTNGRFVNGDPGWDLPRDVLDFEGYGAKYPIGTLPPRGGRLKFNVVADPRLGRNLSYWDGTGAPSFGPVPDGEIVDIYMPAFAGTPASITLDGSNSSFPGFELTSSSLYPGSFHTHTGHILWGDSSRTVSTSDEPTSGFYLFSLNMEIDGGWLFPNYPEFTGLITGINQVSPTFHVILALGFANGEDEYLYGDPLLEPRGHFLMDEEGNFLEDEFGDWIWVAELDEFGNEIFDPVLDEFGNPVFDIIGVGEFLLAPEMQAAVNWVNANLATVPEPSCCLLASLSMAAVLLSRRLA
jgi:surface-anchored protein